jgi:hypothetical protein
MKYVIGTPVPKHNAMNEHNRNDGKVPFILKIKTIWKWSALNSNCFVRWGRDLIPNEQGEGNPTKLVMTTETDILPFNINQTICIFRNYGSNVVYFSCQLTACIILTETVQNLC